MSEISESNINLALETLVESHKALMVTVKDQRDIICELTESCEMLSDILDDLITIESEEEDSHLEIIRLRKEIIKLRKVVASAEYIAGIRDYPPVERKKKKNG
jgi:hypothetical protein